MIQKKIIYIVRTDEPDFTVEPNSTCSLCNNLAAHNHHIVPKVLGGTWMIPLCEKCHGDVHGLMFQGHSKLIKAGMAKARAEGKQVGPPHLFNKKQIRCIIRDRAKGMTFKEIAKKYSCGIGTIHKIVWANYIPEDSEHGNGD